MLPSSGRCVRCGQGRRTQSPVWPRSGCPERATARTGMGRKQRSGAQEPGRLREFVRLDPPRRGTALAGQLSPRLCSAHPAGQSTSVPSAFMEPAGRDCAWVARRFEGSIGADSLLEAEHKRRPHTCRPQARRPSRAVTADPPPFRHDLCSSAERAAWTVIGGRRRGGRPPTNGPPAGDGRRPRTASPTDQRSGTGDRPDAPRGAAPS